MKKTSYKIRKDAGKFHVLERPPGIQYFQATGQSFFSKEAAEAWIKTR